MFLGANTSDAHLCANAFVHANLYNRRGARETRSKSQHRVWGYIITYSEPYYYERLRWALSR